MTASKATPAYVSGFCGYSGACWRCRIAICTHSCHDEPVGGFFAHGYQETVELIRAAS